MSNMPWFQSAITELEEAVADYSRRGTIAQQHKVNLLIVKVLRELAQEISPIKTEQDGAG